MIRISLQRKIILITAGLALCCAPSLLAATSRQKIEKPLQQSIDTRQQTQQSVEKWQADRSSLTAQFDALQSETANLQSYRDALQRRLENTRKRLAAKQQQLAEIEKIDEEIAPFLDELLAQLRQVVGSGVPFLAEERSKRLSRMEEMMDDPNVSISERYRRLMEALQIEAEYGFTTEVYGEEIDSPSGKVQVEVFRLGRLNLFYLSLDGRSCGFYDEATGQWQALDDSWLREISAAIAMARKEKPVDFVSLPIGRIAKSSTITAQ